MDVQLKELIEKIKSEGLKTAEEQSAEIIREAEKKAAEIVAKAESEASAMREKVKNEAAQFEASGKEALLQASRDLIIATRKNLEKLFSKVLEEEISAVLDGAFLEKVILTVVGNWKEDFTDVSLLLPEDRIKELEAALRSKAAEAIKQGLDINPVKGIKSGFRVSVREGSVYYDFSAQGISEILSELLNPQIASILQEAAAVEA
ncbi:MAG: V-type ATP synthase subunit E [Spirochaetes bacterium]|nr:MAG: V-type ATP synthase subunit E [Spirochaetota bacterium]